MNTFTSVYDICRAKMTENNTKYGIYVHDRCVRRTPEHMDKFMCVENLDRLAEEIIKSMNEILSESNFPSEEIQTTSKLNTPAEKQYDSFIYAMLQDTIYGTSDKFFDSIFEFSNDYKDYEYSIHIFEISRNDFETLVSTIKHYFKIKN